MGILVVVFGVKGGFSDVGKYAVKHALKHQDEWTVRFVALSSATTEGYKSMATVDPGSNIGPTNEKDQKELKEIINTTAADILKVDVEASTAQQQLERAFEQADTVISAIGNRQPSMARYLDSGVSKIIKAMKVRNVPRLIQLSSMGIGEDFIPFRGVRIFWAFLLRLPFFWAGRSDLIAIEDTVHASDVDFVLVRTVGIAPEKASEGTWQLLKSEADRRPVGFAISKSDVALFMVEEAVHPTLHKTAVTIVPKDKIEESS